jgi:uncharacterized membrane protein YbhN (UPF0104 family)
VNDVHRVPASAASTVEAAPATSGRPNPAGVPGGQEGPEAPSEAEARVRRPADLLWAVGAVVVIGFLVVVAHTLPVGTRELTANFARDTGHLPRLLIVVLAVIAALATIALAVIRAVTLVRKRRLDGVNAAVGGIAAILVGIGAVWAWHAWHGGIAAALLDGTDGSTFVRDMAIVAIITGSDTAHQRPWGRNFALAVGGLIVTGLLLDELTLFGSLTAVLGGFAVGLLTRWSLRTTVRRPSVAALIRGLRGAGIDVEQLDRPSPDSRELCGVLADGTPIVLKAVGRETRGAGVVRRLWSTLRLPGSTTGRQPLSFRAALETEALATLMASRARVHVPEVLLLAHFEPDTLVLARERLEGPALGPEATSEQAEALFRSLRRLHVVGIAHRDLRAENLLCSPTVASPGEPNSSRAGVASDPEVGFCSLGQAVVGAGELVRRLDVAQLLTSVAEVLGAARAVSAMRAGYAPLEEEAVSAVLQPIALSSWGWPAMRAARGCLNEVRRELLGDRQAPPMEPRLERFRWRALVAVAALTFAAYVLVGQLSKVNLLGALSHVNPGWFGLALIGSALTYVGSSLNLVAFVPQRVSVIRGALVELSGAFIGLVTPPTVGHLAVNGRYLNRQGIDGVTTGTAVALSQLVNFLTTITLLVVAVLITGTGSKNLKVVPGPRLLAVLGGLIVILVVLLTAVRPTKELFFKRVWPRIRGVWPQLLEVISQPMRLVEGVGGNILLTGSYVLALIASLHAVGAHPPIIATAAVFMAGNAVGSAAPTPGGIGAIEAVMTAGLTAIGIPAHEAVPGVLIFRVATFYLPILPGWVLSIVLTRRGIL